MKKASIILSLIMCLAGAACSSGPRIVYVTPGTTSQPTSVVPPSTTTTTTAPAVVHVSPAAYQTQYLQSAVTPNFSITQSGFQITLLQAGYFSASSSGTAINYLRVDLQVVNTSPDPVVLQPSNIAVNSAQAQYLFDPSDGTLNLSNFNLNQNAPYSGYWIFQVQGALDPLNTAQLSFTAGISRNGGYYQWLFQL